MPVITLPDGSQRTFSSAVSVHDVAAEIGPGLAKAALAGKIRDQLVDTSFLIEKDSELAIITEKNDLNNTIIVFVFHLRTDDDDCQCVESVTALA